MRYKLLAIIAIMLLFLVQSARGDEGAKTGPPASQPAEKKTEEKSNWSFFYHAFKLKSDLSNFKFETGTAAYATSRDTWTFYRIEPFVRLRWALFDKYLQLYTTISFDYSSIDYELSQFSIKNIDVALTASLKSKGTQSFGGGAQFFIASWKKLELHGYGQFQSSSLSDAELDGVTLSLNGKGIDIFEQVKDYIDTVYSFGRYDCGAILSYQFFEWFKLSATVGYIWLRATIKITLEPELENAIRKTASNYDNSLIPDKLSIDESSAFGMLAVKFRIYKRLYVNLEGTVLPSDHPVYYGQLSFSLE